MADEIVGLRAAPGQVSVCFYYPIPGGTQIKWDPGTGLENVIPTPSSELPEPAATLFDTTKQTALDNGEAMFAVRTYKTNLVNAALVTFVQNKYDGLIPTLTAQYESAYSTYGVEIDAP